VIDDQDVVLLSTEVALEGLKVDEGHVHCLVQRAGLAELALIGADWPLTEVRALFDLHGAELAGPGAFHMGHGIVVRAGGVFFATRSDWEIPTSSSR